MLSFIRKYNLTVIFYFSVKPFLHQGFPLPPDTKPPMPVMPLTPPPLSPHWVGRSIATNRLRLMEHAAFVERGEGDNYEKHFFVHITTSAPYLDPLLEVHITRSCIIVKCGYKCPPPLEL